MFLRNCARHKRTVKKGTYCVCDVCTPKVDYYVAILRTQHAAYLAEALQGRSQGQLTSIVQQ